MKVSPSSWRRRARAPASSTVVPPQDHLGAEPRVAATLGSGARSGMKIVAGMPEQRGGEGHALGVVAGAGGHDAALPVRPPTGC